MEHTQTIHDYMAPVLIPEKERGNTIPAWAFSPIFFPTSTKQLSYINYTVILHKLYRYHKHLVFWELFPQLGQQLKITPFYFQCLLFRQNSNFSSCHKHLALTSTQKQPAVKRQGGHCNTLSSSTEPSYPSFLPSISTHCHDKPYLHTRDSGIRSTNLCHLQNIAFLLHYRQTRSQLTQSLCSHTSQPCSVCGAAHATECPVLLVPSVARQ